MTRSDILMFTFSLPVYWAIILASAKASDTVRALMLGTLVMSGAEIGLLLAYAKITALSAASQLTGDEPVFEWVRQVQFYLIVNVLPYTSPFIVALSPHSGLRSQGFARDSMTYGSAEVLPKCGHLRQRRRN